MSDPLPNFREYAKSYDSDINATINAAVEDLIKLKRVTSEPPFNFYWTQDFIRREDHRLIRKLLTHPYLPSVLAYRYFSDSITYRHQAYSFIGTITLRDNAIEIRSICLNPLRFDMILLRATTYPNIEEFLRQLDASASPLVYHFKLPFEDDHWKYALNALKKEYDFYEQLVQLRGKKDYSGIINLIEQRPHEVPKSTFTKLRIHFGLPLRDDEMNDETLAGIV